MNHLLRWVLIAVAVGLIIAGAFTWYDQTHLRLVGTTPQDKSTKVTSIDPVVFTFNKPIKTSNVENFTITPYIEGVLSANGNKLTFMPNGNYAIKTTYTATLKSPVSISGLTHGDVKTKFTVNFVPESQLTKEQKEAGMAQTDSLTETNPFLSTLPYQNEHFSINYSTTEDGKVSYRVTLYAIINGPKDAAYYTEQLKTYKQEAMTYFRNGGNDPTNLTITYTPTVAAGY